MPVNDQTVLTISVSVEKVNQILSALGAQPYDKVVVLIGEIQQQARTQLQALQTPSVQEEAKAE